MIKTDTTRSLYIFILCSSSAIIWLLFFSLSLSRLLFCSRTYCALPLSAPMLCSSSFLDLITIQILHSLLMCIYIYILGCVLLNSNRFPSGKRQKQTIAVYCLRHQLQVFIPSPHHKYIDFICPYFFLLILFPRWLWYYELYTVIWNGFKTVTTGAFINRFHSVLNDSYSVIINFPTFQAT